MAHDENFSFENSKPVKSRSLRVIDGAGDHVLAAPEAEALLVSILLQDTAGTHVARCRANKLPPSAFSTLKHRVIVEKIYDRASRAQPVDLFVIAEELRKADQMELVGGWEGLMALQGLEPTSMRFTYFFERVRDVWLSRSVVEKATAMMLEAKELGDDNVGEWIAKHALTLQRMADYAMRANRESMSERVEARRVHALEVVAGKIDKSRWVYTGLPYFDSCVLPFDVRQEDWYTIIGGPPSGGKSSVMRQWVCYNLDQEKRVAVFLLETSFRWIDAAAASRARVNLRHMAEWPGDQTRRFSAEMTKLRDKMEKQLWVFEDLYDVEDIERAVREINRSLIEKDIAAGVPVEKARGLDIVVVDYLQIVSTRNKSFRGNREQEVSAISRTFKKLFKGLDIIGWVGAQINRASRDNQSGAPQLSALRESGSIEQDADRVIFVHTPPENKAGQKQDGNTYVDEVELVQRKSRNGPKDISVTVNFQKQFTTYVDAVRVGDARPGTPKTEGGYKREGSK